MASAPPTARAGATNDSLATASSHIGKGTNAPPHHAGRAASSRQISRYRSGACPGDDISHFATSGLTQRPVMSIARSCDSAAARTASSPNTSRAMDRGGSAPPMRANARPLSCANAARDCASTLTSSTARLLGDPLNFPSRVSAITIRRSSSGALTDSMIHPASGPPPSHSRPRAPPPPGSTSRSR